MRWVIEDFPGETTHLELMSAVKRQNGKTFLYKEEPLPDFPADEKVIFQGSIQTAMKVQKERPSWTVFSHWDNLKCTNFYPIYHDFLFNHNYQLMTNAEFFAQNHDEAKFLRPNTSDKSFSGMVVSREDFIHGSGQLRYLKANTEASDIFVVAAPKTIIHEWRLVCSKGEVVTASRYKTAGLSDFRQELPMHVKDFAEQVLAVWQPEEIFMLDVAEGSGRQLGVLEIGGFSTCGLYRCDLDKIVLTVKKIIG